MTTAVLSPDKHSARLSVEDMNRIIDLDRYPLHRLDEPEGQALVQRCQEDLDQNRITRHLRGLPFVCLLR